MLSQANGTGNADKSYPAALSAQGDITLLYKLVRRPNVAGEIDVISRGSANWQARRVK